MQYQETINKACAYVHTFADAHTNLDLVYHNLAHTEAVVTAVNEISEHYKLNEKDFFICMVASWFHDIGYYVDTANHESASSWEAANFLNTHCHIDDDTVVAIKNCILATKFPQSPDNLLEQIVCDADRYYYGTKDFFALNKLLLQETEALHHISINKNEWRLCTIKQLQDHSYFTEYCRERLSKTKKAILNRLRKKAVKKLTLDPVDALLQKYLVNAKTSEDGIKKELPQEPERGIDTLFRITSGINQRLNEQVDSKAHILITVNSILISVLLAVVVRRLETFSYLTIPVILFLIVNLLTIIFSILAIRPNYAAGVFVQKELDEKKVNLLFFGNFYLMDFDTYSRSMFQVIGDKHYLYLSLIRNLYDQGITLGEKYNLLKLALNVFMVGIVVTVVAFLIAARFWKQVGIDIFN